MVPSPTIEELAWIGTLCAAAEAEFERFGRSRPSPWLAVGPGIRVQFSMKYDLGKTHRNLVLLLPALPNTRRPRPETAEMRTLLAAFGMAPERLIRTSYAITFLGPIAVTYETLEVPCKPPEHTLSSTMNWKSYTP